MELTGNIRYRNSLFGKLILQVEYKLNHCDDVYGSGYFDEYETVHWRDATVKDIPIINS